MHKCRYCTMEVHEWEEVIVQMADAMIEYDYRLWDIVSNFGYSLSTIYRCLTEDLKYIDDDKFVQCRNVMQRHKRNKLPRGRRY